ncbi:MAG: hypothetical protein P1V20_17610 [Verrucomicrobiales bacterium]|nr:hypothetical protein [Verrucomicrobiales bacterium]
MTLRLSVCVLGLIFFTQSYAEEANLFHWAISAGGDGNDKIRGIAAGPDNSIFVTGEISPGSKFGDYEMRSGDSLDFVVARLNQQGEILWVTAAGEGKIDRGYGVSATADGGCYVTGHFQSDTIQFGSIVLENAGNYDGFVARFDRNGRCLWAKRFGGPGYDYGHGIATCPDGTAVLAGTITNIGNIGDHQTGIANGRSAIVAKISTDGEILWSKAASGPSTSGHNIAAGNDGMIYLCGFVRGKVVWSDSITTDNKVQDICIAKYDTHGTLQWVQTGGGKSDGLATSVAVDSTSGNILIAGMFKGTVSFGGKEYTSAGSHDFYTATLSPQGTFLHSHHGGGPGTDYALSATSLPGGGFAVTGEISESGDFNGSTHVGAGARDAYTATFNSDGSKVLSFRLFGGIDNDLSYAIAALEDASLVISGAFRNETNFGPTHLKATKANDIFITRLAH